MKPGHQHTEPTSQANTITNFWCRASYWLSSLKSVTPPHSRSTNWTKHYRCRELSEVVRIVDLVKQLSAGQYFQILSSSHRNSYFAASSVTCCNPHHNSPYWALQRGKRNSNGATHRRGEEAIVMKCDRALPHHVPRGCPVGQPFNMAHGHSHGCCHDHEHDSEDPAVLFTLYQKVLNCFVSLADLLYMKSIV